MKKRARKRARTARSKVASLTINRVAEIIAHHHLSCLLGDCEVTDDDYHVKVTLCVSKASIALFRNREHQNQAELEAFAESEGWL